MPSRIDFLGGDRLLGLGQLRVGHEAVFAERAVGACDLIRDEEFGIILQPRNDADMGLLDVEEERARDRVIRRWRCFRSTG